LFLFILGFCHCIQPLYFFRLIDAWPVRQWSSSHFTEALALCTFYVFLSFAVSHWLGLAYGVWRSEAPITKFALRNATWLQRRGVTGLLGEKPIIYEILSANVSGDGTEYKVFVELEMKNQLGFYSGQVSQFAIVRDEEPHKPIYLIDAAYRQTLADDYVLIESDGVLLDLADVAQVLVRQVAP